MRFMAWLRSITRPQEQTRTMPIRRASRKLRTTLSLELLEDRTLLSAYIVTTTADAGPGSLRDAITQINADTSHTMYASPTDPTKDEIDFDIPTSDPGYNSATASFTIQPSAGIPDPTYGFTGLPLITNSVIINGYTQPGASPNTLAGGDNAVLKIELNGANAGASSGVGLVLDAPNCTVEGLAINGFGAYAVWTLADGETISGNFIGTDVTGTAAVPNSTSTTGVLYHPGPSFSPDAQNGAVQVYGNNNVIGGTTAAARNVISGNDADGIVISGLGADGVFLDPVTGTDVMGNFIGTDSSGTTAGQRQRWHRRFWDEHDHWRHHCGGATSSPLTRACNISPRMGSRGTAFTRAEMSGPSSKETTSAPTFRAPRPWAMQRTA